jgi:hypothetical protein
MQESLRNIARFFGKQGPTALVLLVGVAAIVASGMFVFGHSAFGLNGTERETPETSVASILENNSVQSLSGVDTDADGLLDLDEHRYRTDPKNPDSDGDGFKDGEEVEKGYDPNSLPGTNDQNAAQTTTGSSNVLSLLGLAPVDDKVDGLNVGGLGGLPQEELEKLQNTSLDGTERLADLEMDRLLTNSSQPLPSVDPKTIKATDKTDAASEDAYTQAVYALLLQFNPFPKGYNLKLFLADLQTNNRDMFEKMKLASESVFKKMSEMEVPKTMVTHHAHALGLLQAGREALQRMIDANGAPQETMFVMGRTVFWVNEFKALMHDVNEELSR